MANYKYEHVAKKVKDKILKDVYLPGSKLPSIQELAKEFSLNKDTIIRAYKLLEAQHLIYSVPKSGYYVMKSTTTAGETTSMIDMRTTCPANEVNPYKDFYHCMEKAISLYEHKLFAYSPPKGMPELISILRKHLTNHQIFAKEQDIFITTGAQQALFILTSINFPNGGDTILVEQPTYNVMLETINANHTPVIGISRTERGIDFAELERIFANHKIKFFYLMPRFQNPTGFSYTNAQKKEILRLAKKYQVYLVEDDYLVDLETDQKNDPIAAFDTDNLVIYVKSFSKTLLPGLRLGMTIIPTELQAAFIKRKYVVDLNSSVFSQGALEIYLRSSMYKTHVKRTKIFYQEKMTILRRECEKELAEIGNYYIPPTGIFAHIEIGNRLEKTIISRLEKGGLKAMGTSASYLEDFPHPPEIRLCTCKVDAKAIPTAVQVIRKVLLSKRS